MPTVEEGGVLRYSLEELPGPRRLPTPDEQEASRRKAQADYDAAIAAGPSVQLLHDDGRFYSYTITDDETHHDPEWKKRCRQEAELASNPLSREHPLDRLRRRTKALHAFDQRATLRRLRASKASAVRGIPAQRPARAQRTRREAHGRPRQANAPPDSEGDEGSDGEDDPPDLGERLAAAERRLDELVDDLGQQSLRVASRARVERLAECVDELVAAFPSEGELATAVASYASWHAIWDSTRNGGPA